MSNNTPDYIRVGSIDEIDPNKLSLAYIGKKFIDKDNNRFSIRFNKDSRKMEVVKIMIRSGGKIQEDASLKSWEESTSLDKSQLEKSNFASPISKNDNDPFKANATTTGPNANTNPILKDFKSSSLDSLSISLDEKKNSIEKKIEHKVQKQNSDDWNLSGLDMDIGLEPSFKTSINKKQSSSMDFLENPESGEDESLSPPSLDANSSEQEDAPPENTSQPVSVDLKQNAINERTQIEEMMKELETAKNRINSVLINIKSSRIFEVTGDPSENQNIIGNLTRDFDVEAFQILDKLSNYLKELVSFPRAINYYTAKYERSKKDELKNAGNEKEKLNLVIRWEMQEGFTIILDKLKTLTLNLLNVMNLKTESHIKQLQYSNQLMFTDAKNATVYCSQDLDRLIRDLENWKYKTK
jgi:hypothetical protein